jgi:uncharacterized protein YecT (DUF1311 family)
MKLTPIKTVVLTALIVVPMLSTAGDDLTTAAFEQCMGKAHANVDMMDCIDAEIQRQDQRLNKVYKTLGIDLSDERKTQLRDAQRAWIKFRDANCGFYRDPDGGSLAGLLAADCMMRLTADRAQELADFLPEGQRFPIVTAPSAVPTAPSAAVQTQPPATVAANTPQNLAKQLAGEMGAERTLACMFISAKMTGALLSAQPGTSEADMRDGFMAMSKVYGGLLKLFSTGPDFSSSTWCAKLGQDE